MNIKIGDIFISRDDPILFFQIKDYFITALNKTIYFIKQLPEYNGMQAYPGLILFEFMHQDEVKNDYLKIESGVST